MKKNILKTYLGEIVYGGNDGIITTFAIVSGFSGATLINENTLKLSMGIVILFGFANLFADAFSMGAGNYLSKRAQDDAKDNSTSRIFALKTSTVTFGSFVLFGALPLIPYLLGIDDSRFAFIFSIFTTLLALFLLGFLKGLVVKKKIVSSILETILIGGIAAVVAFLVGVFLKVE